MYIGSAGPGPGGRTDGRTGGGRTAGRTGRRAAGMILNECTTIFIDFHKKQKKHDVFCRFASGGSASTDFYSSNEKHVQKTSKNIMFFDFSNQANAQVPIFIDQNTIFEHLRGSPGNGARTAARNPPTTRRGPG